jgi:hypothetical protein
LEEVVGLVEGFDVMLAETDALIKELLEIILYSAGRCRTAD